MTQPPTVDSGPFKVPWQEYLGELSQGLLKTLEFTIAGFVGAALVGLLIAVMRLAPLRLLRIIGAAYTELFKNIPLITAIFVIYFGLPQVGIRLPVFVAGTLGLIAHFSAYLAEIFRGALVGVPAGQREAGQALGLSGAKTFLQIILPQAARIALPGTGTMLVDMLKGTALLVVISGSELMTQGTLITAATFRPLEVYMVIGAIYFAACFPLSRLMLVLERRLEAGAAMTPRRIRLRRALLEAS